MMPIFEPNRPTATPPPRSLVDRIRTGRVVPILSDEGVFDLVLGSHQRFTQRYADYIDYPLPDKENLVKMAKFHKLKQKLKEQELKADCLNYVKNYIYFQARDEGVGADLLAEAKAQVDDVAVSTFAHLLGYPRLNQELADPLLVIANLPFKTILTTSPYTFLEDALRKAGKQPRTELCRWRKELDSIDSVIDDAYKPSAAEPLVYHLHGLDQHADSLVLTEDDYLEFLVNVCQGQGNLAADRVHPLVRKVLSDDLIVMGFSLNSWAFRVLYAGLIKPNGKAEDRGICCLQLIPNLEEKNYLEEYVQREAKFEVVWGDLHQYTQQLWRAYER
jgi:hypothetical protein